MNITERVKVKQRHINYGICEDSKKCAVTIALLDHFGDRGDPEVVDNYVVVFGSDYEMDAHLSEWIYNFDTDKASVEPITMVLNPKMMTAYIGGTDPQF